MSTGGSFVPAAVPECPYAPRMTRAAALALRTAGALLENCVVVITDGPTIGTAGNTSPTEIELNPTSPTELGLAARVHTTFAASAWDGLYDIDLGAAGSITRLTDDFGNTAVDVDADSPTVHGQFPWHLGSTSLRDNYVEDSTLTGWDTQVGFMGNNRVLGSTVDLTGKTAGVWTDNELVATVVVVAANTGMQRMQISGGQVANPAYRQQAGAGTGTLLDSTIRGGMSVEYSGTGALSISRSTLSNTSPGANGSIVHAGGGSLTVSECTFISSNTAGFFLNVQTGTTGSTTFFASAIRRASTSTITKVTGASGPLAVNNCTFDQVTITIGATNAASSNNFQQVSGQGVFTLNGPVAAPGRNDFTSVIVQGAGVTVAATATAGAALTGGRFNGTFMQNRTAGTASTTLFEPDVRGFSTVVDNGTTDPTVGVALNRVRLVDAAVNIGDLGAKTGSGTILQQSELTGSTLNLTGLPGGQFINRLRMLGATLTNGGFDGDNLVLESNLTKIMGAAQSNRHGSIVFDNWI